MRDFIVNVKDFWKHLFTDAAGRTDPKLIVAYSFLVFAFQQSTAEMFLASAGIAVLLLFGVSIFDHKIDMKVIAAQEAEEAGVEPQTESHTIGFVTDEDDDDDKGS